MRYLRGLLLLIPIVACCGVSWSVEEKVEVAAIRNIIDKHKAKHEGLKEKHRHKKVMKECKNGNC